MRDYILYNNDAGAEQLATCMHAQERGDKIIESTCALLYSVSRINKSTEERIQFGQLGIDEPAA